jgi:hypothetical protein
MAKTPEPTGTYDDVNLILRLYELRREERMRQAREWFAAKFHFKTFEELMQAAPIGSSENASYRMVTSYWEMVASFITGGVLKKEIFFQSQRELLFVYTKIAPLLPAIREMFKDPLALKNIETVSLEYIEWMDKRSPGAYEAFRARIMPAK